MGINQQQTEQQIFISYITFLLTYCFIVLTLWMLGKKFRRRQFEIFSLFSRKIGFDILCKLFPKEKICRKYQILFSDEKNQKNKNVFVVCWFCEGIAKGKHTIYTITYSRCDIYCPFKQTLPTAISIDNLCYSIKNILRIVSEKVLYEFFFVLSPCFFFPQNNDNAGFNNKDPINPCPAEPRYTLPLQTVYIQISWLLALFTIKYVN